MDTDNGIRILLVGGDEALSRHLACLLEQASAIAGRDYRLRRCATAQAATAAMRRESSEVVLLAMDAPLLRAGSAFMAPVLVEAVRRGAATVLLTEAADPDLEARAFAHGVADCLALTALDPSQLDRCLRFAAARAGFSQSNVNAYQLDVDTGLVSRAAFRRRLETLAAAAQTAGRTLALLHIDLDGFRRINHAYSHDVGDAIVGEAARRLRARVRERDVLARLGSDAFGLILESVRDDAEALAIANDIAAALAAPYPLDGDEGAQGLVALTASVGVALTPSAGTAAPALLRNAELALAAAKQVRGSCSRLFHRALTDASDQAVRLEAELRRALRRGEFTLVYQPRVELDSGTIVGVEALLRWQHPERGLLSPDAFLQRAEESGLIVPIGYWIIQQACADIRRLDLLTGSRLDLAINLSFRQLLADRFVETASRLLLTGPIAPSRIEFELTETAIMHNAELAQSRMLALAALGATFSLDDFGTGYSSFAHLRRLPIAALKIDRSFVQELPANHDDALIVKAIVGLAHGLDLRVVAEGAETLEQVQFLWHHRCDELQGYYYSRPVALEQLAEQVRGRATASR